MNTLREIFGLLGQLWNTGDRLLRIAVLLICLWPFVLIDVALLIEPMVVFLAILPVFGSILLLAEYPMVIAVVSAFDGGRRGLRWIATIIGAELVIGFYLSVVSVSNDPMLVPLLIISLAAILFFAIGAQGDFSRKAVRFFIAVFLILTAIFLLGGTARIRTFFGQETYGVKLAILGLALLAMSFVPRIPGKKLFGITGAVVALLALVYLVFPAEMPQRISIPGSSAKAPADTFSETQEKTFRVPLLGEGKVSEMVVDIDEFPPGFNYFFEGPESAEARYSDGTRGPITKWFGVKRGKLRFTGPAGQEVTVRFVKQ